MIDLQASCMALSAFLSSLSSLELARETRDTPGKLGTRPADSADPDSVRPRQGSCRLHCPASGPEGYVLAIENNPRQAKRAPQGFNAPAAQQRALFDDWPLAGCVAVTSTVGAASTVEICRATGLLLKLLREKNDFENRRRQNSQPPILQFTQACNTRDGERKFMRHKRLDLANQNE